MDYKSSLLIRSVSGEIKKSFMRLKLGRNANEPTKDGGDVAVILAFQLPVDVALPQGIGPVEKLEPVWAK